MRKYIPTLILFTITLVVCDEVVQYPWWVTITMTGFITSLALFITTLIVIGEEDTTPTVIDPEIHAYRCPRTWDKTQSCMCEYRNYNVVVVGMVDKVQDEVDAYTQARNVFPTWALLKPRPYNWEAELFHTKDEEEIYISSVMDDINSDF